MNNKDQIQKIIDEWENQEMRYAPKVIEQLKELINEKWEPKDGLYFIYPSGIIRYNADGYCYDAKNYGNEWPTKELAETARDMNKRNQLILQAKHEMGYGDGGYVICYNFELKKWKSYQDPRPSNPETTFEYHEDAETVIKMVVLND